MTDTDKELFKFDKKDVDHEAYIENTLKELRMNVLKETEESIESSRKCFNWRKFVHFTVKYILIFFALLFAGNYCRNIWNA